MRTIMKSILSLYILSLTIIGVSAASWTGNLAVSTPPWGKWSGPTHGVYKDDNDDGAIQLVEKTAAFATYGDLYSKKHEIRVSNYAHQIPFEVDGRAPVNKVYYSYNGKWNGEYISARVSSAGYEPKWNTTTIKFIP